MQIRNFRHLVHANHATRTDIHIVTHQNKLQPRDCPPYLKMSSRNKRKVAKMKQMMKQARRRTHQQPKRRRYQQMCSRQHLTYHTNWDKKRDGVLLMATTFTTTLAANCKTEGYLFKTPLPTTFWVNVPTQENAQRRGY